MKNTFVFLFIFLFVFLMLGYADTATTKAVTSKPVNWKDFINMSEIFKLLASLFIALLTMATKALITFINNKSEEAKSRTKNILAKNAFGYVNNLLTEIIESESELIKDLIDKIMADGKITKEEKEEAVKKIKDEALRILGAKGLKQLDEFVGDSKEWITKKISAFLSYKLSGVQQKKQ